MDRAAAAPQFHVRQLPMVRPGRARRARGLAHAARSRDAGGAHRSRPLASPAGMVWSDLRRRGQRSGTGERCARQPCHADRAAHGGGFKPQETLDAVAVRLHPLITRQYRTFHELAAAGHLAIVRWEGLTDAERAALRARCTEEILPFVSPKALTRAPGHPFPLIGDRRIALLVVLKDRPSAPVHYAIVELPQDASRFIPVAGGRWLAAEDLVRANLDLLYPGR